MKTFLTLDTTSDGKRGRPSHYKEREAFVLEVADARERTLGTIELRPNGSGVEVVVTRNGKTQKIALGASKAKKAPAKAAAAA